MSAFVRTQASSARIKASASSQFAPLQRKLSLGATTDPLEAEADRVADQVLSRNSGTGIEAVAPRIQRFSGASGEQPMTAAPTSVDHALASPGRPLEQGLQQDMERRFGHDFSRVRVHSGTTAENSARDIEAHAYTVQSDIVFGRGRFAPETVEGRRLLAHELTHVVQQGGTADIGLPRPVVARPLASQGKRDVVQRDGPAPGATTTATGQAAPATPAGPNPAEALLWLDELAHFIHGQMDFVALLTRIAAAPAPSPSSAARAPGAPRQVPGANTARAPAPGPATPGMTPAQRANRVLNQSVVKSHIINATEVARLNLMQLPPNAAERNRLRTSMVQLIALLHSAANQALQVAEQLDVATRDAERIAYVETLAQLAEATPMTSGGLAGGDLSAAPAGEHLAWLRRLLDDLATRLPQMGLNQSQRDQQYQRLQIALRRAMVTTGSDASGAVSVTEITDPGIRQRYREVVAMLIGGQSAGNQPRLITDTFPPITLPDPIPAPTTAGLRVDVTGAAPDEADAVRYGVDQMLGVVDASGSPVAAANTIWPVVLPVRRGGVVFHVRYELTFISLTEVRAERLGEAVARRAPTDFSALSLPDKKARMVTDFGLAAVDDRPGHGTRPAADWTDAELEQVFTAYQRFSAPERAALQGVTLVRDHAPSAALLTQSHMPAGSSLNGYAHSGADTASDSPAPPAHGAPHIHYFDTAFSPANAVTAVGPAGGSGPGGDWTLLHEVGHQLMFIALRGANAEIRAANTRSSDAITAYNSVPGRNGSPQSQAIANLRTAWQTARATTMTAISAFNSGVSSTPPAANLDDLLTAVTTAQAARDTARAAYSGSAVSAAVTAAVTEVDASGDALLAASIHLRAANEQVSVFRAIADRFGFSPITSYAATGDGEFFAESFALYVADPDRMNAMNPRMYQWFAAGMPFDASWSPPTP
jgi:hypothetical protein